MARLPFITRNDPTQGRTVATNMLWNWNDPYGNPTTIKRRINGAFSNGQLVAIAKRTAAIHPYWDPSVYYNGAISPYLPSTFYDMMYHRWCPQGVDNGNESQTACIACNPSNINDFAVNNQVENPNDLPGLSGLNYGLIWHDTNGVGGAVPTWAQFRSRIQTPANPPDDFVMIRFIGYIIAVGNSPGNYDSFNGFQDVTFAPAPFSTPAALTQAFHGGGYPLNAANLAPIATMAGGMFCGWGYTEYKFASDGTNVNQIFTQANQPYGGRFDIVARPLFLMPFEIINTIPVNFTLNVDFILNYGIGNYSNKSNFRSFNSPATLSANSSLTLYLPIGFDITFTLNGYSGQNHDTNNLSAPTINTWNGRNYGYERTNANQFRLNAWGCSGDNSSTPFVTTQVIRIY